MKNLIALLAFVFIVKWIAVETHLTGCPSPPPYTDEYGITHIQMNTNAVACFSSNKKSMEKEFATEVEADEFIKHMPQKDSSFPFETSGYAEDVIKFESKK